MAANSETRTLLVILGVVAALGCGCMCVPLALIGVGLGVPAAMQMQKAADRVAARENPLDAAPLQPIPLPEVAVTPPPAFEPPTPAQPSVPHPLQPEIPSTPSLTPPPDIPPPVAPPVSPPQTTKKRDDQPKTTGLAALDEPQRQAIYRTVAIQRQIREQMVPIMQKQRETMQKSGVSTAVIDRSLQDLEQRIQTQLDQLCQRHNITRAELDQIVAEGDREGWRGARPK